VRWNEPEWTFRTAWSGGEHGLPPGIAFSLQEGVDLASEGMEAIRVSLDQAATCGEEPFRQQLLKWVGNKQRFAHRIVACFPGRFGAYFEPFLGSGAVLGTLSPRRAYASDAFAPLMEIWLALKRSPGTLKQWYRERWERMAQGDRAAAYEAIKAAYNARPNGADLVFLCRACYGGVVRFRRSDGFMSTPCGVHRPIPPERFAARVDEWHRRTSGAAFAVADFAEAMAGAEAGDLVYCDPPYRHSQTILYGAQSFSLERLWEAIARCRARGVHVALTLDGSKKSGSVACPIAVPKGIFRREATIDCGRSMLRRFQMSGRTLHREAVADRLLMTY
jgi:DNA adenine methylase